MVTIGIIGCGHWGANHVRIFNALDRVRLKICCDKDKSRLKLLQKTYPSLKVTSDYNELLKDRDLDGIVVATPTATHYPLVRKALLNGKHVLCEKPLSIKREESNELMLLAKEKQRTLMTGYVFLYNNGIIALKDYIEKRILGRVFYLQFTRTNLGPIRDDVDVVYDLASHDVSIASFLLGRWPEKVSANAGYFLRKKFSDIAFITLYFPANTVAHIHVSWLDPCKIRRITCLGDKKMAVWDDLSTSEPIRIFDKGVIKEPFYSDYGEFQLLPREGKVTSPLVKLVEPLKNENAHFLDCIYNGKESFTDAEFAHNITRILEAIQSSIKNEGRIQRIM